MRRGISHPLSFACTAPFTPCMELLTPCRHACRHRRALSCCLSERTWRGHRSLPPLIMYVPYAGTEHMARKVAAAFTALLSLKVKSGA